MSDQLVAEAATYTTHNNHKRLTFMPSAGFEPGVSAISLRPQVNRDRRCGTSKNLYSNSREETFLLNFVNTLILILHE